MKNRTCLGVIGGSGLYDLDYLTDVESLRVDTPFGLPSGNLVKGKIKGRSVIFLSRHGRGHRFTPSEINFRANIFALKKLGVSHILSVSAVGSLQENLPPGTLVVPSQLLNRTTGIRARTFFGDGVVGHVSLADPFCPFLREQVKAAGTRAGISIGEGGTLVVIEGPSFSTRAESHMYRQLNTHLIGMTGFPEASLAREAELPYCTLALVTDYDCWKEHEAAVDVKSVVAVLQANVAKAKDVVREVLLGLPEATENPIFDAARFAIMTPPEMIPVETKRKLELLYGKYWENQTP